MRRFGSKIFAWAVSPPLSPIIKPPDPFLCLSSPPEQNKCGAFHCGPRLRKDDSPVGSIPSYLTSGSTQPEWEEEDQPNSGPLCTFAEADQSGILEKGRELLTEGGSRNEGGGKLPLLECKLIPILCPSLGINTAQSSPVSYLWSLSPSSFVGLSLVSQVPPLPSVARAFLERESPTLSNFLPQGIPVVSCRRKLLGRLKAVCWGIVGHQKLAYSDIYFFSKRSCPIVLIRKVGITPLESECQLVQQNPPLLKGGSEPAAKRVLEGETDPSRGAILRLFGMPRLQSVLHPLSISELGKEDDLIALSRADRWTLAYLGGLIEALPSFSKEGIKSFIRVHSLLSGNANQVVQRKALVYLPAGP
uniref:Uncharacterized protein n=1 Tax=Ficus carica TaxID=3494 RepID=A0AA87ZFY0_FICCA|nr:hypothetical protein TIFTF001_050801 [Ficus carica]